MSFDIAGLTGMAQSASDFFGGWAQMKFALEQKDTQDERWERQFQLQLDQNRRAEENLLFEKIKYAKGAQLRDLQLKATQAQLDTATLNLDLKKQTIEHNANVMGAMSETLAGLDWSDPDTAMSEFSSALTAAVRDNPLANTDTYMKLYELYSKSASLSGGTAWKNDVYTDRTTGETYTRILSKNGDVVSMIPTGQYSEQVNQILKEVPDEIGQIRKDVIGGYNIGTKILNAANKGTIKFSEGIDQADPKETYRAIQDLYTDIERVIEERQEEYRKTLNNRLTPFVKDKDKREEIIDSALGPPSPPALEPQQYVEAFDASFKFDDLPADQALQVLDSLEYEIEISNDTVQAKKNMEEAIDILRAKYEGAAEPTPGLEETPVKPKKKKGSPEPEAYRDVPGIRMKDVEDFLVESFTPPKPRRVSPKNAPDIYKKKILDLAEEGFY